jgi:hypothetical protein
MDLVMHTPQLPIPGETLTGTSFHTTIGGNEPIRTHLRTQLAFLADDAADLLDNPKVEWSGLIGINW